MSKLKDKTFHKKKFSHILEKKGNVEKSLLADCYHWRENGFPPRDDPADRLTLEYAEWEDEEI